MFILGLTGGIGSGKSAASGVFKTLGVPVVDADVVAREVVMPTSGSGALAQITMHFDQDILLPDGQLDRVKLRKKIFADATEKQWLNNLLHPLIRQSLLSQLHSCQGDYAILEAPLLIENDLLSYIDKLVVVDVPEDIQLKRAMVRDHNSKAQIESIMAAQVSRAQRLKVADYVLDNSADLNALAQQVKALHQVILSQA
ncbi:dephospho-CoA kinase [Motilimonas sp. 1_MG-2023]|uniref:dephospho-CoA kinase n=1 Tax=Motilimonas sp. 1_MG-2023 TaxID=3062672 RepID=UPI0026E1A9E0|nr:dephospho-CoA kinase [Motilimonas sp. 1_MG-2023]MDO6524216.1 dephospho-CoA kinase [Motilimonas sp. 1_MG-2023]